MYGEYFSILRIRSSTIRDKDHHSFDNSWMLFLRNNELLYGEHSQTTLGNEGSLF